MKSHIFWQRVFSFLVVAGMLFGYVAPVSASASAQVPEAQPKADILAEPELMAEFAAKGSAGYLVYFKDKADLSEANKMDWSERGWYVYNALTSAADQSQAAVRQLLDKQKVEYQAFWIDNVIVVESSDLKTFNQLFGFTEIESLRARREPVLYEPEDPSAPVELSTLLVEPNLLWVGADQVWAQGINGSGIVVANIDTGVRYTHQALVNQYRGTLGGGTYDHNYNWWDPYAATQTFPNDVHNHGSHTMGTMLGDDGAANQIGMAPAAKWIACKGFNPSATDAGLLQCAEFMAAPWNLSGANPNPDLRPHIVNNSWGDCGQTYDPWYAGVLASWHAAGIYPVFSNGNSSNCGYASPPGLNTVGNPARSGNVTGVGSTGTTGGVYATYSNWGPTDNPDTINPRGYPSLKPQVVAPGTNRSAYKDSDTAYGGMSGTSMAGPHVAGLIALIWSAAPCLVGDYALTETIIEETANPIPYATGGTPPPGPGNVPNYATGWGEIRALAAVNAAANLCGDSEISGVVTDYATGLPIAGAMVRVVGGDVDRTVATDATGAYSFALFEGTYDLTATKFGYLPASVIGVELGMGEVVTINFALQPAASAVISGAVTDAATGWPLYARIAVSGAPVPAFWNDPVTGAYSITLPEGGDYGFTATAYVPGYLPETGTVVGLSGPTTLNLELDANLVTCNAPGYTQSFQNFYVEYFEDTNGGYTNAGPQLWEWGTPTTAWPPGCGEGAKCWGTNLVGNYANSANYVLMSPVIDLGSVNPGDPVMAYWQQATHIESATYDKGYAEFSIDGGPWTVMWQHTGGTLQTNWHERSYTLPESAAGSEIQFRFRLTSDSSVSYAGYYVDAVRVAIPACAPTPGSIVVGQVYDANTMAELPGALVSNQDGFTATSAATEDPAVGDAFFVVFSPNGEKEFSATKARYGTAVETLTIPVYQTLEYDFYVPAGQVVVDPEEINVSVELGSSLPGTLSISNAGGSSFTFEIQEKDAGSSPLVTDGEQILVVRYDTTSATAVEGTLTAMGVTFLGVTDVPSSGP
jgi:subtilisin family serine protease